MLIAHVTLFKDRRGELLIIPTWRQKDGPSISSMKYKKIDYSYTESELGKEVLQAIEISKRNEQEELEQEVYKVASGLKSWNSFQKKYENVAVSVLDTGEWKISKYLKQKGHSYGLNKDQVDKYTKIFSEQLSSEALGKVILEMFDMK